MVIGATGVAVTGADKIYARVTLEKSKPKNLPVFVSLLMYRKVFDFERKIAFGKEDKIVSFPTKFHDVLDWKKMEGITPLQPGEASNWIDITDWVYTRMPKVSGWFAKRDEYSMKILVFGFFAPQNDKRRDKRPIHKYLEMGNLDSVTAKIDFATAPEVNSIFRRIVYESQNSCVPVYLKPDAKGVKSWGKSIMSLYEKAEQRLADLKKIGIRKQPLPQKLYTSIRIRNGYFYSVFDKKTLEKEAEIASLLGVRSIMWWGNKHFPKGFDRTSIPRHRPFFEEGGFPNWVSPDPWGDNFDGLAKKYFDRIKRFEAIKYQKDDTVMYKYGDEWKLIKTSDIKKYPNGLKTFRQWLKDKKVKPEEIGVKSLEDAMPLEFKRNWNNKAEKKLFYLTNVFRQDATVEWWKKFMRAAQTNSSCKLIKTSETCWENARTFPDIFKVSEANLFDVASHEYAQLLWVPSYAGIFKAAVLRTASKYTATLPGILYGSHRGGKGMFDIIELDGTTALLNGMRHFYWYSYGPYMMRPGGEEKLNEVAVGFAKIMHRFATLENMLINGKSSLSNPEAALLKSFSSELWHTKQNNPSKVEFRMAAAALAWNQIPFDVLSEEWILKYLKNYRVLYVVTPNIPEKVQIHIVEWVKNGGTLFMTASAAEYDESNEKSSLFSKFGNTVPANIKDAPIKVSHRKYGKGLVIRTKEFLGRCLKDTFSPAEKAIRQKAVFHKFDDNICKAYLLPFELNKKLVRPLIISKTGVEAAFYESPELTKAIIIMADYESPALEKVDVSAKFDGKYRYCKDENGIKYPVEINGGRTFIKGVRLKISNVLFLTKE
jgi:hypothetical protein